VSTVGTSIAAFGAGDGLMAAEGLAAGVAWPPAISANQRDSVLGLGDSASVLVALAIGLFAPLSGWAARLRSRSAAVWFVLGAASGPMALLILAAAPPGRCPDCDRRIPGWERQCRRCGAEFPPFWEEPEGEPVAEAAGRRGTTVVPGSREHVATAPASAAGAAGSTVIEAASVDPATPVRTARGARTTKTTRGRSRSRSPEAAPPLVVAASPDEDGASPPVTRPPVTIPPVPSPSPPVASPAHGRSSSADPTPRSSDPLLAPAELRVLSTGIYILGNAGLEVGARYALAQIGDRLRIFGPVDLGEVTVRHERAIAELEITAIGDQLIITAPGRGSGLAIVFQGLGGMQATELEKMLTEAAAAGESSGARQP